MIMGECRVTGWAADPRSICTDPWSAAFAGVRSIADLTPEVAMRAARALLANPPATIVADCAQAAGVGAIEAPVNVDWAIDVHNRVANRLNTALAVDIMRKNRDVIAPAISGEAFEMAIAEGCVEAEMGVEDAPEIGGIFDKIKGLVKKVKKAVSKVTPRFVKKAVTAVTRWTPVQFVAKKAKQFGTWVDKAVQHPAFGAAVFVITQAVPGAQAAGYVYLAVMAARKLAAAAASSNPDEAAKALADMALMASAAGGGSTIAKSTLDALEAVKKSGVQGATKFLDDFPVDTLPPEVLKAVREGKDAVSEVKSRIGAAGAAAKGALEAVTSDVQALAQNIAAVAKLGVDNWIKSLPVSEAVRGKYRHLMV